MELDRAYNRPGSSSTSTTSDLFICFQSRLSHSSSMRKSIVSPGRNDKPPISLQTSLSRRMRSNNGSLRGQQSPMFPPGVSSKKRGCAFENPEPSSPKVTCIGQVRVKTKKQGKKMKMNMKAYTARRIQGTTTTSNTTEEKKGQNNGFTICDALKDFSCLLPCKSTEKQGRESSVSSSTCGGGMYRWLVAFNGEGRTRDIELVVEEEEEEEEGVFMERESSRRRSIFDDMDFNVDEICGGGGEEKGSRVSICVPPKNALLLMRCRSDPVKVSALANKFMESQSPIKEDDEEEGKLEDEKIESFSHFGERRSCVRECEKIESLSGFDGVLVREEQERRSCVREDEKIESFSCFSEEPKRRSCVREDEKVKSFSCFSEEPKRRSCVEEGEKIESFSCFSEEPKRRSCVEEVEKIESFSCFSEEPKRRSCVEEVEKIESFLERRSCVRGDEKIESFSCFDVLVREEEQQEPERRSCVKEDEKIESFVDSRVSVSISEDGFVNFAMLFDESPVQQQSIEEDPDEIQVTVIGKESIFELPPLETKLEEKPLEEEEEEEPMLPDCLLLMMCEPKLSMEVSEETWVCSTDFLQPWLPESHRKHQLKKLSSTGEEKKQKQSKKNRAKTESVHPLPPPAAPAAPAAALQPPRSSCSFPISMASLIERKLVGAVAYEPFVLTRCKSEPMRTAAAKIEPHRPANCGFGF